MDLLSKQINPDKCPVIYDRPFSKESLEEDFEICGGNWYVEDGWLIGENRENCAAMVISRKQYNENVILDFKASTIPPCTHDINVMWNGNWNRETNYRDIAYVSGLQGWWVGKVGIEKSPEYKLNVATPLFDFEPGKVYHIQCGSINGHCFTMVDGKLLLEVTDPDPIDFTKYGLIGFEAYCTKVRFTDFKVRRAVWTENKLRYEPEF